MNGEFIVAVHALAYLANHKDRNISSEELAEKACSNPARIRKVAGKLVKGGFIETKAGVEGGYKLIVPQEKINLLQVLDALGGDVVKVMWHLNHPDMNCFVSSGISGVMDGLAAEMNEGCRQYLAKITIQDVIVKLKERSMHK